MAERRRIVIPTGLNPDESLASPHFDAEATLTARPVVPLAEQETFHLSRGDYPAQVRRPFWKRPGIIALIVLIAVGVGVAAGLAIGVYRNRKSSTAPVAATPPAPVENSSAGQTLEPVPTPSIAPAAVAEKTAEPADEAKDEKKDEERVREARKEQEARKESKEKDEVTLPPAPPVVVRDNRKPAKNEDNGDDEQVLEDRQAERERRREERREQRRRQREEERATDIPRGIERAEREVNRIREIFEGRQP